MAAAKSQGAASSEVTEVILQKVLLSEAEDNEPKIRAGSKGGTRATSGAAVILNNVGQDHGVSRYFIHAAIIEGVNTGSFYLVPTDKDDPDKLRLRWVEGNHAVLFSMRKFFKVKHFTVPKGHAWSIPCVEAKLKDGLALEMVFPKGKIEPIQKQSETAPAPAAAKLSGK